MVFNVSGLPGSRLHARVGVCNLANNELLVFMVTAYTLETGPWSCVDELSAARASDLYGDRLHARSQTVWSYIDELSAGP